MRGESMKDKSKKSTYSTTFGVDPKISANKRNYSREASEPLKVVALSAGVEPASVVPETIILSIELREHHF